MSTVAPEQCSPELELVLALLRTAVGGTPAPRSHPSAAVCWPRFLALVERHRVAGVLERKAGAALSAACPPEVRAEVIAMARRNALRSITQAAEQVRLGRVLQEAGIPVMPVKGVALASLYGGLGVRHAGDIDLLIPAEQAERADGILQAMGLRRTRPEFDLTPRQTREYLRLKPEFEYVNPSAGLRVELLWRLEGLRTEEAWDDASAVRVGAHEMKALPRDPEAAYLILHGARHGWFRLFWLVDIALLLQARTIDWTTVRKLAADAGAERAVAQALALSEALLGVGAPAAGSGGPQDRRTRRLVDDACRMIIREPQAHESVLEWVRQLSYRIRLHDGLRSKLAVMKPHLLSPQGWQTLRLPDRWFFVYPFATPFLWVWRRARRAR